MRLLLTHIIVVVATTGLALGAHANVIQSSPSSHVTAPVALVCLMSNLNSDYVPIVGPYRCRTLCHTDRGTVIQLRCEVKVPYGQTREEYEQCMCGALAKVFGRVVRDNGYVQYCFRVDDELWADYVAVPPIALITHVQADT